MGIGITASAYSRQIEQRNVRTETKKEAKKSTGTVLPDKPVWNPRKVYTYLEDMAQGFQDYRKEAVSYYSALIESQEGNGVLTEEELKAEIQKLFPEYTLTDSEPKDVVPGKFYLYIDARNLQKMASDPAYRAKVYGLMDTEIQGKYGYTLKYSDGRNVTAHLTGSIFSLSGKNKAYDGIPYRGSCTSDHCISTSESHPQVRSMDFLSGKKPAEKEERKGSVGFNAGKRAAQIAASMTSADISAVMGLLAKDLSDCRIGAANGMCSESEVNRVRAMMQKAEKKRQQLELQHRNDDKAKEQDDRLTIMLM